MKQPTETGGAPALAQIQSIKVADIVPDPKNRKEHDKVDLATLAASIERDGLLQPVIVRDMGKGKFMLIAGERRWEAHRLLKRAAIEARVMASAADAGTVDQIDGVRRDRIRKRAAENFHRVDLSPIEKAQVLQELFDAKMSQKEIAEFVGVKDQSTVSNFCRLLRLPDAVKALVHQGQLSAAHAKALLKWEKFPIVCTIIARTALASDTPAKTLESDELPFANTLLRAKAVVQFSTWQYSEKHFEFTPEMKKDDAFVYGDYHSYCLDPIKWAKEEARQLPLIAAREKAKAAKEAKQHGSSDGGSAKEQARAAAERKAALARNKKRRELVRGQYAAAVKKLLKMASPDALALAVLASEAVAGGYHGGRIQEVARDLGLALPKGVVSPYQGLRNVKAMAGMKAIDVARLAVGVILHKQTDDACRNPRGYTPGALNAYAGGAK